MKKRVMVVLLLLVTVKFGFSQVNSVTQAQSMFIYNFSRLIQWPTGSTTGQFVIGVVGSNELYNNLVSFVANKRVGSQSIAIRKFDDPQSV